MTRSSGSKNRSLAPVMLVVPLILLGSGCFDVTAPAVYRCNVKEPECPPGLFCSGGLCVSQVSKDAAADVSRDARRDVAVEAGDDAAPDAAPVPDLTPDGTPDATLDV